MHFSKNHRERGRGGSNWPLFPHSHFKVKIFNTFFGGGIQGFLYWGNGGSPLHHWPKIIPPSRIQLIEFTQTTKFNFSIENIALIYKVNCNLKLLWNSTNSHASFYLNITEKGMSLFIFVLSTENNETIK